MEGLSLLITLTIVAFVLSVGSWSIYGENPIDKFKDDTPDPQVGYHTRSLNATDPEADFLKDFRGWFGDRIEDITDFFGGIVDSIVSFVQPVITGIQIFWGIMTLDIELINQFGESVALFFKIPFWVGFGYAIIKAFPFT